MKRAIFWCSTLLAFSAFGALAQEKKAGEEALGSRTYADFENPKACGASCHVDFYQQWQQAMMSQAYTHHWDEIEYFKLAVPHAEKDPKVAGIEDAFIYLNNVANVGIDITVGQYQVADPIFKGDYIRLHTTDAD